MTDPKQLVDDRLIMLLYRLTGGGIQGEATMEEIKNFGLWAEAAATTALECEWLRKTPRETLELTAEGREALEWALEHKRTVVYGGSVPDQGAVVSVVGPKMENVWHLQKGLTEEDFETVVEADRFESVYDPKAFGFPSLVNFHSTFVYGEGHPFYGRELDPGGYPGEYLVTVVLRRQGAPDSPKAIQLDAGVMEGDSHLHFPEGFVRRKLFEKQSPVLTFQETSKDGDTVEFVLVPNMWQRLGKILVPLEADNYEEAFDKSYETVLPMLCDLSYRYDVPLDILQVNVAERTTLSHMAQKMPDYPEARLDESPFGEEGLDYSALPLYSTLTYLYREGLNSSSVNYGFLCFYKVIEGILKLRKQRASTGDHRRYDNEKVEGEITKHFSSDFHGKRFGYIIEKMAPVRDRIAHAFLDRDGPDVEQYDYLEERLKLETEANSYRAQARELVRVMMHNEYWEVPSRPD
jgi:hypothetical protein